MKGVDAMCLRETHARGIIISSRLSLVPTGVQPRKGVTRKKKKTEGGVSCLGLRRGWVALLHVFLKPKTKTACIPTPRAVNATRYPPQEPAMMRLGRKKKSL